MTRGDKALDLARDIAFWNARIRRLTDLISRAKCPEERAPDFQSHLNAYYYAYKLSAFDARTALENLPPEQRRKAVLDCPVCSRTHRFVQMRKHARRERGKAVHSLAVMGRTELRRRRVTSGQPGMRPSRSP